MRLVPFVLVTALSMIGCRQAERRALNAKASRDDRARGLIAQRQQAVAAVGQLPGPELVRLLSKDAERGVSTLASLAFAESTRRGKAIVAALNGAASTEPNALNLLALRAVEPAAYRSVAAVVRIQILVEALASSRFMVDFGLPHRKWGPMAEALIESGDGALTPLAKLLSDKRPILVSGSESAEESQRYGYRICDYAWLLSREIRGMKTEIPASPHERDKIIGKD